MRTKHRHFILSLLLLLTFLKINAQNTYTGTGAGGGALVGTFNSGFGANALNGIVAGATSNSAFGTGSGKVVSNGDYNSFFGYQAGFSLTTGLNNVFLGAYAGNNNVSGSNNVFIGFNAGYNETGSDKLYIDNSNTSTPLIFGNFSSNQVGIQSLPNSTHTLTIGGSLYSSSSLHGTALYANDLYVGGSLVKAWNTNASNINYTAGGVGIGTTTIPTDFKLAVGGKVIAEELVIKLKANWPDYVFEKNYQLQSLEELQVFIAKHKHLPGVPSAQEVESNGVSVGEMNAVLLKKIEELTLYLIQQKAEIEALKKMVK